MSGQGRSLRRDAFHQVAVADQGIGHVVDDGLPGAVVAAGEEALGDGHADRVGGALAEGTRGRFDARCAEGFRVAGRPGAPLAEGLELVERQVVAIEVQKRIDEHRAVAGRKHEAVAVGPLRVLRVVAEMLLPKHVGHGRGPHG